MKRKNNKCILGGYSLRGGAHIQSGTGRQDHVLFRRTKDCCVCVVADGLGSCKHSRIGARSICEAVLYTALAFSRGGIEGREQEFIPALVRLWRCMIYPLGESECSTTCIFAVAFKRGKVLLGQVGDGILFYEYEEEASPLCEKEDDFLNLTHTVCSDLKHWTLRLIDVGNKPFSLYMHTDGLDIIPAKRRELLQKCREIIGSGSGASAFIKSLLLQCRTGDSDDITMAFMRLNDID